MTELVRLHGAKKWALISKDFKEKHQIDSKTGKQCRERWNNNLSPAIKKESWSVNEEKILFEKHKQFGNKWSEIAKFLKGRTDNSTKNHFYSIVRKNLRKYNKTKPLKEKITGNIQDLIISPETSKILLKKPRHYHKKKTSKDLIQKPPQHPESKPKKTTRKPVEMVVKTEVVAPGTIYHPTPIPPAQNPFFKFPQELAPEKVQISPDESLIMTQIITRREGKKRSTVPGDLDFLNFHEGFKYRNPSRDNSVKSNYSDIDYIRTMSRKNSDKVSVFGKYELVSPFSMTTTFSFPPYSPSSKLSYRETPKNQKT